MYYLRGVVSIRDSAGGSIALFTDIAVYINWIIEVRQKVEGEESPTKFKPGTLFVTLILIRCIPKVQLLAADLFSFNFHVIMEPIR